MLWMGELALPSGDAHHLVGTGAGVAQSPISIARCASELVLLQVPLLELGQAAGQVVHRGPSPPSCSCCRHLCGWVVGEQRRS